MSDHSKTDDFIVQQADASAAPVDLSLLDPSFLSREAWLRPPPVESMARVVDHLAHKVSRHPSDLMSHVQRIALCHEVGEGELIYGAVLDLFIALGNSGVSLRTRMLQKVADLLSDEQLDVLQKGLISGVKSNDTLPLSRYSRLSGGVVGDTSLVEYLDTSSRAEFDTIDEARDLIDSGHIELAQKLLEEALLGERMREDISLELLEIYRHTQHQEALFGMRERLGDEPFALADEWEGLINSFAVEKMPGGDADE